MGRITQGIKKTVKPFVDIPAWMGFGFIKDSARNIKNMIIASFVPQQTETKESFDEAIARQRLTDADVARRKREFGILAFLMFLVVIAAFCYFIFLIINGHWKGALVCFGVVLLAASLAFRYHFWRFQLEKRRLGCSFREWFNEGLLGRK